MARKRLYASLYERLVANTWLDERTGCWLWTGAVRNRRPAITVRPLGERPIRRNAGRVMLEEVLGYEFPFDEVGHYHCYEPLCICPGHIRVETQAENLSTRRGYAETKCGSRWIPVLFPTEQRLKNEALDALIDIHNSTPGFVSEVCPF